MRSLRPHPTVPSSRLRISMRPKSWRRMSGSVRASRISSIRPAPATVPASFLPGRAVASRQASSWAWRQTRSPARQAPSAAHVRTQAHRSRYAPRLAPSAPRSRERPQRAQPRSEARAGAARQNAAPSDAAGRGSRAGLDWAAEIVGLEALFLAALRRPSLIVTAPLSRSVSMRLRGSREQIDRMGGRVVAIPVVGGSLHHLRAALPAEDSTATANRAAARAIAGGAVLLHVQHALDLGQLRITLLQHRRAADQYVEAEVVADCHLICEATEIPVQLGYLLRQLVTATPPLRVWLLCAKFVGVKTAHHPVSTTSGRFLDFCS